MKQILSLCATVKMMMERFWILTDGIASDLIVNNVKIKLVQLDQNQKLIINPQKQPK